MTTRFSRWQVLILMGVFSFALATALADTVKLKNGRVIKGQVVRFDNGEFIIVVQPADAHSEHQDRRIVLVDSVESIEFDATGAAAAPSAPAPPAEKLIVLDDQQEVVATGLLLRRGDRVRVRASGEMQFSDGRSSTPAGVSGSDAFLPFPGERIGVLVAMVGSPQSPTYHVVGEDAEFESRSDGELFLQINARSLQGARGAYTARIRAPQPATATAATPAAPAAPVATQRQLRGDFDVPADREWLDTKLDLVEGDTIRITAEGTVNYSSSKTSDANGGERDWKDLFRPLPVNDRGRGALIGKMGEGGNVRAFFIGKRGEFTAERDGRLFLGVNDDDYGNNRGSFRVRVEITPARR